MTQGTVQVRTELPGWAAGLYSAIDANDGEAIVAHFCEDIRVRFGNAEPIVGRDTFLAATAQPPAGILGMSHAFRQVWECGDSAVLVADVNYTRRDGAVVCLPAVTIVHRRPDGLIDDMQVFVDITPAVV